MPDTTIITTAPGKAKTLPVLVIDDSESDRKLMVIYLTKAWPFEREPAIQAATDGFEALEKMRQDRFALIVLDWNLPRGGSGHVLREMRHNGVFIPVVVVSGLQRDQIPDDLSALGAAYLDKNDFNVSTFYLAIADAVRQAGPRRGEAPAQPSAHGQLVFHSHAPLNSTW